MPQKSLDPHQMSAPVSNLLKAIQRVLKEQLEVSKELILAPEVVRNPALVIRGRLILTDDLAEQYLTTLNQLAPKAGESLAWSRSTVDEALSEAVLEIVESSEEADTLRHRVLKKFVSGFKRDPRSFQSSFSVFGLGLDCEGLSFGALRFLRRSVPPHHEGVGLFAANDTVDVLFGECEVLALDGETAKERSAEIVDRHLAVLNVLCIGPRAPTCRFSRRFFGTHSSTMESVRESGSPDEALRIYNEREMLPASRAAVEEQLTLPSAMRLSSFLTTPSPYRDRILVAYEFAGAAVNEPVKHKAFLLFAIALESAVLGKATKVEITYQLATRTAHLVATSLSSRKQIAKKVRELYNRRSEIVHTGSTAVSPSDVSGIKGICLAALSSLLLHPELQEVNDEKVLDQWFEEQLLGSALAPSLATYRDGVRGKTSDANS